MSWESFVKELKKEYKLSQLAEHGEGIVLKLQGKFRIVIEPHPETGEGIIYGTLGSISSDHYGEVLKANLFGHKTKDCVFSLSPEGTEVLLHRKVPREQLQFPLFQSFLDDFISVFEHWVKKGKEWTI